MLVGAVLAPQQGVHRQLDCIWRRALLLAHELVLRAREPQRERILHGRRRGVLGGGGRRSAHAFTASTASRIDSKMLRPSAEPPVSSSTACSGWGIRPNTLPCSLQTPAMSRAEPLKFSPAA